MIHIIKSATKKSALARTKRLHVLFTVLLLTVTISTAEGADKPANDKGTSTHEALEDLYKAGLTRKLELAKETVRMLDDLYKTFIILITREYADDPSVLAAATLSKKVFKIMSGKGWHKARLLDATGSPYNPENNPRDDFERDAIKALTSGKSYFERVEKLEGRNYLRAATTLTANIEGCTFCHPDKNFGDLLGAISYGIPLDDRDYYLE
ncbi:MAG: DUF3365 domain-containing protein [Planctomycetes bacterium]|nr:DUF3365 domain-containing protein [Planctomycetota bacterium]